MIKYYYRKYLLRGWPNVSAIGGPLDRHTEKNINAHPKWVIYRVIDYDKTVIYEQTISCKH